jgi:N-methylhydantoinase A
MWRVGIDTGGTFTDIVAVQGTEVRTAKVPSTPPHFDEGLLKSIEQVGVPLSEIGLLAHGTTVTTNAVITKSGARAGLITTRGFRDVLELRRHNRGELYDLLWDPPEPLVPRQRRLEVTERLNYAGDVIVPLKEDDVVAAIERLQDYDVQSVAVCFLNSYQNPAHEERVREILKERWPTVYVSISSALLREAQEFERTSTTVVNAYVGPILAGYLEELERRLKTSGFEGRLMIMHSGGGLLPAESALAIPARTVTSGPAAGAMAAEGFTVSGAPAAGAMLAEGLASTLGIKQLISLDMGGTSADIAVVRDGRTLLINEYVPEFGSPIRFPAVDLITIGAGGGSIAWIDSAGSPRVGPQSAGAVPGPAAYGRGGTEATVTDANLVLGRLSSQTKLAGRLTLDPEPARLAVERFGSKLGLNTRDAALGIVDIANSNMARAIRVMTVERGLDPRQFVLLPFGGAGPMHACELADGLGISHVLVPIAPGVTSALGTLFVDVVHDVARSHIASLSRVDGQHVERVFRELEDAARNALTTDRIPKELQRLERSLDLRYVGQVKALTIPIPNTTFTAVELAAARRTFLDEYQRQYQYITEDIEMELAVIRVRGRGLQEKVQLPAHPKGGAVHPIATRRLEFRRGSFEAPVFSRDHMGSGVTLSGPAIIEQLDSTTVLPPSWRLVVDPQGNLSVTKKPEPAGTVSPTRHTDA